MSQSTLDNTDFGHKLKSQTIAVRLQLSKLGTRKALTPDQRRQAADQFGADYKSLSASKRIIDTKHPAVKAVRQILRRARSHWTAMTTPYPEPGVRLIRKSSVTLFVGFLQGLQNELAEKTKHLQSAYPELKEDAAVALADLFNPSDYPSNIASEFGLFWDFPSIDPPAYLKNLNPELYDAECKKIEARFSVAVEQAEQAFTQQFQALVSHLVDRLKGESDGKPKVFKDATVNNLNEFFAAFRQLDIGSNSQLQVLIGQAENAVKGITAGQLRDDADTRQTVATAFGEIADQLDGMMADKPERLIELPDDEPAAGEAGQQ